MTRKGKRKAPTRTVTPTPRNPIQQASLLRHPRSLPHVNDADKRGLEDKRWTRHTKEWEGLGDMARRYIEVADVKSQFPAVWADFLSGDWEDNETGAHIMTDEQLMKWLNDVGDEFYVDSDNSLHWVTPSVGDQDWKFNTWWKGV